MFGEGVEIIDVEIIVGWNWTKKKVRDFTDLRLSSPVFYIFQRFQK